MSNWHIFGGIVQNATSSTPLRSASLAPSPPYITIAYRNTAIYMIYMIG